MTSSLRDRARDLVDELVARGARFTYRAASSGLPASFIYELTPGGNRQACRSAIARAKGDAQLWAAVVHEIALRSKGAA